MSYTRLMSPTLPTTALANSQIRWFAKGATFPLEDNTLWTIEEGLIRTMTWDETGDVSCVGIWGPGDIISASLTQVNPYQIECLSRVTVRSLHPQVPHLDELLITHSKQVEELLSIIHCRRIGSRLLKALKWLAYKFGQPHDSGLLLDIPVTHQCLAELIGTTRVTITRLLGELETSGQIQRFSHRRILVETISFPNIIP
ncbi:Crp/Fnr family transcriptional regulator [Alkalinema pantanalense CENA528]|uniref:Crp/Fnr family transcriptional regulator n=1 Tax=Alkalinema pantanalense TaxID=1620705 RepID=UPI003D6E169C